MLCRVMAEARLISEINLLKGALDSFLDSGNFSEYDESVNIH